MIFEFGFYSSILLIFFVHMLVYSILLFVKHKKEGWQAPLWLGVFLLLAILYITPWMVGFAGWYGNQPYRDILFYTPFQHLFLIGPVVYFYTQSLLNPAFSFTRKQCIHIIPAILYAMYCIVMVVYDKLIVHEYYFLKSQQDPDFDLWYQLLGFISMIVYFVISIKYYIKYKKIISQVLSNAADFSFTWIKKFLIAFLAILITRFVYSTLEIYFKMDYGDTWWYFLAFSIICYYIAIAGYANTIHAKVFFKTNFLLPDNVIYLLPNRTETNIENATEAYIDIPDETAVPNQQTEDINYTEWKQKITLLFTKEKLFEEPELSLVDMARKTNTNVSLLSKIINKGFGVNFNDLVNTHRVKAIMELLHNGEHKKQTLLSIAYECGFNSKTTFNRAFKKYAGVSPQEFIKRLEN
jgi:AraC-like DNA-binding protein